MVVAAYSLTHTKLVMMKNASKTIDAPLKNMLHIVIEFSILGINRKNNAKEDKDLMDHRETIFMIAELSFEMNKKSK